MGSNIYSEKNKLNNLTGSEWKFSTKSVINKGDVISIIGSSGSGKTTFLRCLNFLEKADEGELIFDGQTYDLKKMHKKQINEIRKKTGFVFQNYNLFRNKNVLQNVTEGLIVARKIKKEQAEKSAVQMLKKVGMEDRAEYFPHQCMDRFLGDPEKCKK